MIPVTSFAGRRVAVIGLGASGRATVQALLAGGADVAAWDDGARARDAAAAAGLPIVDLDREPWSGVSALVLAPGIPLTHPVPHWSVERARAIGAEVIGDIELFFRERMRHAPESVVVAITGTNGKSTTTALISHALRSFGLDVAMGGNIGHAVLSLAPPARERVHVIEISSFQIDLTPSLAPTIGVHLNLSADHIERHGDFERYAAIKERLVAASHVAVVGIDDAPSLAIARRRAVAGRALIAVACSGSGRSASFAHELVADGTTILSRVSEGQSSVLGDIAGIETLRGLHNAQNALAALAVMKELLPGRSTPELLAAFRTYPGLPHRLEQVGRLDRVVFVNDSKATNADSTARALAAWDRDIHWILGGKAKDGGIAGLTGYFPRIARAYLIGEASAQFAATLAGRVEHEQCGTLEQAVSRAAEEAARASAGSPVVLLSPACASYDQFRGFDHRGDRFRELVQALPGVTQTTAPLQTAT